MILNRNMITSNVNLVRINNPFALIKHESFVNNIRIYPITYLSQKIRNTIYVRLRTLFNFILSELL